MLVRDRECTNTYCTFYMRAIKDTAGPAENYWLNRATRNVKDTEDVK